ncbi:MAG TPA: tetratricopeptide repeat protein [Terriglobales bacterium]|nr:tetratricopeptide repeat protein [Terriglobales bacterium]
MPSRFIQQRIFIPRIAFLLSTLALAVFGNCPSSAQPAPPETRATPNTPEAHLGKGYDALKQDRYDVAVEEFRAALAMDPKLTLRARFPLAVALFELHKSDEARREFTAVRRETGDHANVFYYLGRLDLDERKFDGAIQNLTQAAANPPFPDTAYYLGFAYFKQDNLAAAEKWLQQAAQVNPRDARVPYQLGLVFRKQGRDEEARKALALSDDLRQRDSRESQLRLECRQKLDQGLREEARAVCEQLYDPDNADKLTELGTIYGQHGDLEAALKPLRRAAELAPQSPQMQYNLALAYYQLNRFEDARAPLAHTLKRWPDLFQLNALYGAVLMKLGEYTPAYQTLGHAHQLNPQDTGTEDLLYLATFELGRRSQDARQYPDALRYFEETSRLRPQEPAPHRHLAEIYTLTGHAAQAGAEQQEADRLARNLGGPR